VGGHALRSVEVKFNDGTTRTYATIKDAATDLHVCPTAFNKLACGEADKIRKRLGIASVVVHANRRVKHIRKIGGAPLPLKCTHEDGRVIYAKSIKEAVKLTGFKHVMHFIIDDGFFHWGWRFDSLPRRDKDAIIWGDVPVPDSVIEMLYAYAGHYMKTFGGVLHEDREDIIQHAVNHVASEYSMGEADRRNPQYSIKTWCYLRIKHKCGEKLREYFDDVHHRVDMPDNADVPRDVWLDNLAQTTDVQSDEAYIATLPKQYQQVARLLLEGRNGIERTAMMHTDTTTRLLIESGLRKWLMQHAGNHDCSCSD